MKEVDKNNLPATIICPDAFIKSPAANFDGVFDWSWTQGCFGNTKIKPMDINGLIERNNQFLIFETKDSGVAIPQGQLITLDRLWKTGPFTIMLIWGKRSPEYFEYWPAYSANRFRYYGVDEAIEVVKKWFEWADNLNNERR